MAGGVLELRHQLEIGLFGGDRREDFDFHWIGLFYFAKDQPGSMPCFLKAWRGGRSA